MKGAREVGWSEGHTCTSLEYSSLPTAEDSNPGLNPACLPLPQTYTGVPPESSFSKNAH